MELGADVPAFVWYLDNLNEVCRRIDAHALHACLLVFFLIGIVELIAMAMPLLNNRPTPMPLTCSEGGK